MLPTPRSLPALRTMRATPMTRATPAVRTTQMRLTVQAVLTGPAVPVVLTLQASCRPTVRYPGYPSYRRHPHPRLLTPRRLRRPAAPVPPALSHPLLRRPSRRPRRQRRLRAAPPALLTPPAPPTLPPPPRPLTRPQRGLRRRTARRWSNSPRPRSCRPLPGPSASTSTTCRWTARRSSSSPTPIGLSPLTSMM